MAARATELPDFYAELEVEQDASPEAIKAAYLAMAKRHHPDRNEDADAMARMRRINEAYDVLRDAHRRTIYDVQRLIAGHAAATRTRAAGGRRRSWRSPLVRHAGPALRRGLPALAGVATVVGTFVIFWALSPRPTAKLPAPAAPLRLAVRSVPPPTAPSSQAVPAVAAPEPTSAPAPHAIDVIIGALARFSELDHLREAAHKVTAADRAWTFEADGCLVFAGEYDTPAGTDTARAYWDLQQLPHVDAASVVISVSQCDTPAQQAQVLDQLRRIMASVP